MEEKKITLEKKIALEKKITLIDYTGKEFSFSETDKCLSFLLEEIESWRNISTQYNIEHESKYYKLLSNHDMESFISKNNIKSGEQIINDLIGNIYFHTAKYSDNHLINAYNKGREDESIEPIKNFFKGEGKISLEWLYSKHFFTQEFCLCVTQYGDIAGDVFLNYILNKKITIEHLDYNNFNGLIAAFKAINLDELGYNRLDKIATEFGNRKDLLEMEISNIKSLYRAWKDTISEELKDKLEYIEICKTSCDSKSKQIDDTLKKTNTKAKQLEDTYEDKLRLSKPAEYWHKSAGNFLWQAGLFGVLSLLLVIAPIIVLICSGKEFIDSWFSSDLNITYNIPRMGVIIFMLAIYTYLVRLVAKLTFSSLHLMRDAQEREQLTYVYLSLINENSIDEKSRDIVLQALFSRTETGLLANENGPTMPLSDVLQAMKK